MLKPCKMRAIASAWMAIRADAAIVSTALLVLTVLSPALASDAPRRIVSLNLCTDQVLVDLVAPERIVAISYLAADADVSPIADRVRHLRTTRGAAEDVLSLDPDLVLAGAWTTPATVDLLRRLGRRVERVPLAGDVSGVRAAVRQIAAAVGEVERGETMIAEFDRRITAVEAISVGAMPPTALIYQVNGLASGAGSLADDALRVAGFRNLAREIGLGAGGRVELEKLVTNPPDLLVFSAEVGEYRTPAADNLSHPAIAWLRGRTSTLALPWRQWLCATPGIINAIERLAVARSQLAVGLHRP